jgi:hypothetical protein
LAFGTLAGYRRIIEVNENAPKPRRQGTVVPTYDEGMKAPVTRTDAVPTRKIVLDEFIARGESRHGSKEPHDFSDETTDRPNE